MNYPEQPIHLYTNPALRPEIEWREFPKDMIFDDYQNRALAMGMTHSDAHGRLLFETAKYGTGEGFIVEIGSYHLLGACYLAAGSKTVGREKVISIDIDKGDQSALYSTTFWDRPPTQIYRAHLNLIMMGVQDWVIPMRCSSIDASRILNISVRGLHVDGGHSWPDPAWDIINWGSKLLSGCRLILHDRSMPDVARAIEEYVINSAEWKDYTVEDEMTAWAIKV